ncbi:hypothetical protein PHMEG_00019776, partial [Phytophthora megakarya]
TCSLMSAMYFTFISPSSCRTPSSSYATTEAAANSAFVEESETPPCFLQIQLTAIPSTVTSPPVIGFLSASSAA